MIIKANKDSEIPASTQVKRVGKYLYNNIDSAYKFKSSSNTYDVYITVFYQLPTANRSPYDEDIHEMNININITTYQNKLRVNTIEMSSAERTLGFDLFKPETLKNLKEACEMIYDKVCKRIVKAYEDYDFIF